MSTASRILISLIPLGGVLGVALASVPRAPHLEPSREERTPCVGIVSVDYGADGRFDAADEVPVEGCRVEEPSR
ncbi:MAG: hypothetical protein ACFB9M_10550 [Myxococcota bacterium]